MMVAMPVAFLVNPLLLGLGALLVAIPIIIHLLNRRRVRRVDWAAMDWLLAALKRHQRRLRLENWLILALRCLAILLLGLALARPVVTDAAIGLFGEKRSVYVVVDTSYSTSSKTDARSVFERVKQEAELVLGGMNKQDSLAVVATNNPDEDNFDGVLPSVVVTRTLGSEGVARAKEAVAALQPRHAPARWADTLQLLQEQIQTEDTNREVVLITDLQAKDWLRPDRETVDGDKAEDTGGDRLTEQLVSLLRKRARVRVLDVGGADRRNLAVTRITNRSERGAFVGRPLQLEVEVANYGTTEVDGAVLEVSVGDDAVRRFPVPTLAAADAGTRIPKPSTESVRVDLSRTTFTNPGSHEVRVRIGPPNTDPAADGLGIDSERWFVVSVRRRIEVLAYTKNSERKDASGRRTFRLSAKNFLEGIYEGDRPGDGTDVLGLGSLYSFEHVTLVPHVVDRLRDRRKKPIDLVVLANTPIRDPNLVAALRAFVREGGGLMVWSGDQFENPAVFNEAFFGEVPDERLAPFALGAFEERTPPNEQPFAFDLAEQVQPHPLAAFFTGPGADLWLRAQAPRIWGRTPFIESRPGPTPGGEGPEPAEPIGRVVLPYEDGKPAIVASELGEGRTLWISTSLDTGWMTRAAAPFLPVFLEEAALWLTEPKDDDRNLLVGDRIALRLPAGAEEPRFSVPGGMQMAPTRRVDSPSGTGQSTVTYDTVGVAGVWKLSYTVQQATGDTEKVVEMIAVNPDPSEGSLLPASTSAISAGIPPELDLRFQTGYGETSEEIEDVREGEMTRYVIWALLAILLLESLLAMRFGRRAGSEGESA